MIDEGRQTRLVDSVPAALSLEEGLKLGETLGLNGTPSYVVGTDVGIFPFPTIDASQKNAEGSADTMMMLVDRPEVRAVMEFFAVPAGLQAWIAAGSAISTNTTIIATWHNDTELRLEGAARQRIDTEYPGSIDAPSARCYFSGRES